MTSSHLRILTLGTLSLVPSLHAAPLLPGKKIGIDFGPTLTANWNNFTANGTKADGAVIHLDGSVSDGLTMTTVDGQFYNTDGSDNWVGLQSNTTDISPNPKAPAEFVDSVTTDIAGNFNLGDARPFTLRITGLNPYLAFKVDAVSAAAPGVRVETLTIVGKSTYGPSDVTRASAVASGIYHHFTDVSAAASGELSCGVVDTSTGTNPILNGILLEVTGPTAEGLADNDGDTLPNWWEAAYRLDPESNADGGNADADGDGFSNVVEFNGNSDPRNPFSTPTPAPKWAVDGDGSWNTAANWTPSGVPNGINRSVVLSSTPLATAEEAKLSLGVPVTLGSLVMTGYKPFRIGAESTFTFNSSSADALLDVSSANGSGLTFEGNMMIGSALTVSAAGQSVVAIEGTLSQSGGTRLITKTGTGDLLLAGSATAFDGDFDLRGGRLVIDRPGNFAFPNLVLGSGSLVHSGGGVMSLSAANSHSGGTFVLYGSVLETDHGDALGTGPLTLGDGTLRAIADIFASGRNLNVAAGGATVAVPDAETLVITGGSVANSGPLLKTGLGTWRIQGGSTGTLGTFTVAAGLVDLANNDRFGSHATSQQDLVIEAGATVTNGTGATGFNTFRSVSLAGGRLSVTNSLSALSGLFQAYHIKDSIVVEGDEPAFITDEVNGSNGAINIGGVTNLGEGRGSDLLVDVADVSGDVAADLTISAKLKNSVTTGYVALPTGLVKTGEGTLVLTRPNLYTGNTSIETGTLVIQQAYLADGADVSVANGCILRLEFTGTNVVDQLTLGGVGQAPGVYGAMDSTAQFKSPLITGSGTLTVTTAPAESPFRTWMAARFPALVAPNNEAGSDPDGDGASNFQEFAFGGDPTRADNQGPRRVAIDEVAGIRHLTITFACRDAAAFTGTGPAQASIDGVGYTVRGTADLASFTLGVDEIAAITTGLPEIAAGYRYRTFQVTSPVTVQAKAFLQLLSNEE